MRTYIQVTGLIFLLVVLAHLARAYQEGARLALDPWFLLSTALSAGLTIWAWRLLRR